MPWTRWANIRALPPVRARAHDGPTAASSTARADSRAPWPYRTPEIQPGFRFRRDRRLLARSRSVVESRQRAIGQRPLDAALDRLMMYAKSLSHGKKRPLLAIGEQHLRPLHVAGRLGPRPRRAVSVSISSAVIAKSTARRHPAMMPLLVHRRKRHRPTNLLFHDRVHGIGRRVAETRRYAISGAGIGLGGSSASFAAPKP